jgi:hypothetical protein
MHYLALVAAGDQAADVIDRGAQVCADSSLRYSGQPAYRKRGVLLGVL